MDKLYEKSETGCCPRFNPKPWDGKTIKWKDKLFLKERVTCFFHIPIGFGKLMVKDMEMIKKAGALAPEPVMLFDYRSLFSSDVYIAVKKEMPGKEMAKVSGTYLSKVFEGPFKDTGKWVKEMRAYVKSRGKEMKCLYYFFTTCPACAKAYGKNYTVLLAKI
jgi:hypothetical protein